MRCSNIKKYNQPQIKWMQEIMDYFQIHFIEDGQKNEKDVNAETGRVRQQ
jgi:hypothetical protein